ncbi:hypothetical protein ABW21_db0208571 [Orbilia brochopaga]|nr:hypothetical protein ABW21_db0208571 [Drechslerella brochopaga]
MIDKMGSMCLEHMSSIGTKIEQLGGLVNEIKDAESAVQGLVADLEGTVRQLANLKDFLSRSNFTARYKNDCELSLQSLGVEINKLTNLIDGLRMKIHQQSRVNRAKHRLHLISGGYKRRVEEQIDRIQKTMVVVRQEMWLDISLNRTQAVSTQEEQEVEKVTTTDASNIRKEYRRFALAVMVEEHLITYTPQTPKYADSIAGASEGTSSSISRTATVSIKEVFKPEGEPKSTPEVQELEAISFPMLICQALD